MYRIAAEKDKPEINRLRAQMGQIHADARPDLFKPNFRDGMEAYLDKYMETEGNEVYVCEEDGRILAMCMVKYHHKPDGVFSRARDYCQVSELCVDEGCRGKGIGSGMMKFLKETATEKGFGEIMLEVWELNPAAQEFYAKFGMTVQRRFMEIKW